MIYKISIILPILNEESSIENTLLSIISNNNIDDNIEIIVVDGISSDNTQDIVKKFIKKYSDIDIVLLENKDKSVPYAMNIGIKRAKGDIIIRLDAHSIYPKNYINILVDKLISLNASNVGGVIESISANNTLEAQAIAKIISHPFGIGGSDFRVGGDFKEPYMVDTVPFGCYKKEIFNKIGLYDTDLIRNQDDELNARLIENGGKIFLIPTIKIQYFARDKFSKVSKMFYQYGLFKPLVNLKLKKPATIRQFVPPLFVLFLIFGVILSIFNSYIFYGFISILSIYILLNLSYSINISKNLKTIKIVPYIFYGFFLIHISYGFGYLKGIIEFVIYKKHKNKSNTISISR